MLYSDTQLYSPFFIQKGETIILEHKTRSEKSECGKMLKHDLSTNGKFNEEHDFTEILFTSFYENKICQYANIHDMH